MDQAFESEQGIYAGNQGWMCSRLLEVDEQDQGSRVRAVSECGLTGLRFRSSSRADWSLELTVKKETTQTIERGWNVTMSGKACAVREQAQQSAFPCVNMHDQTLNDGMRDSMNGLNYSSTAQHTTMSDAKRVGSGARRGQTWSHLLI